MSSAAVNLPIQLSLPTPWRRALPALFLLLAWVLLLYRDTAVAMVLIWSRSETFTHAFLVPPISLWLIWRQRRLIALQVPQPSAWVFPFIALTAFAWLLGDLVAVNSITQLAFVALLVLTVPALLGWSVARLIIFPLGFLFFAVPIGEFLLPQLMLWTANFTVAALRLSGVPVYREGLQFVIPSGSWSVVEACSGVRYLMASLTVGTLFAYLNYRSSKRRILFVIVALLLPIVANWIRAYMIVMLGHLSGNKIATGVDHLVYGWIFFGIVITVMFIIGARWAEPETESTANIAVGVFHTPVLTTAKLWASAACFATLVALPHIAARAIGHGENAGPTTSFMAPATLAANWPSVTAGDAAFRPAFQNPTAEVISSYANQGQSVTLYIGLYRNQNYSRKLVGSGNALVGRSNLEWAQVSSASDVVDIGNTPVTVQATELRGPAPANHASESRLVAWQIYWVNGTLTSSDLLAKLYSAFYQLVGRGDDSAVIIVYTSKDQSRDAEALLKSFLTTNYAAIDEYLRKAQQQ